MQPVHQLYVNIHKHKATALFLLHTEVVGLNAWLVLVQVSEIDKWCSCEWSAQTVCHILLFCSIHTNSCAHYFQRAGIADLHKALSTAASAHQVAQWLATSNLFSQFNLARQITKKDTSGYGSLLCLDNWKEVQ